MATAGKDQNGRRSFLACLSYGTLKRCLVTLVNTFDDCTCAIPPRSRHAPRRFHLANSAHASRHNSRRSPPSHCIPVKLSVGFVTTAAQPHSSARLLSSLHCSSQSPMRPGPGRNNLYTNPALLTFTYLNTAFTCISKTRLDSQRSRHCVYSYEIRRESHTNRYKYGRYRYR